MSEVGRRLAKGFGAQLMGPFATILIQILNVPLFFRYWGPTLFGEWLILTAIPNYLLLTDLGFGSVAGNDMAIRAVQGDTEGALSIFQSTWALISSISLVLAALIFGATYLLPVDRLLNIHSISLSDTRLILVLLCLDILMSLQASLFASGFRAGNRYALGTFWANVARIVESAASFVGLIFGLHPVGMAVILVVVHLIANLAIAVLLLKTVPWLSFGFGRAKLTHIRPMVKPAFAFMAFPAGNALSIQGMVMVVGLILGPIATATFVPMRTLSRAIIQFIDAIKLSFWPEFSSAYGRHDWQLARRLHRFAFQMTLLLSLCCTVGLALVGPSLFRHWTHNRVQLDMPAFVLLLVVAFVNCMWNTSSTVQIAANKHIRLAIYYVLETAFSLVIGLFLVRFSGLKGASASLLVGEVWMAFYVVRTSNKLLEDNSSAFFASMLDTEQLRRLVSRIRAMLPVG